MSHSFIAPNTLDEALTLLAEDRPPQVLAGGTDLWPLWTSGQLDKPARVLSLHRLQPLQRIQQQGSLLRIGAGCTHATLGASPEVQRACPSVAQAAATIGAAQIQNRGTVGGNLVGASPAADLPPALCAIDASVELSSVAGTRQVPLHSFYLGYRRIDLRAGELLTAVLAPPLPAKGGFEYFQKVGTRRAQAISKVAGACRILLSEEGSIAACGVAFGSVGPTVVRLADLEQWLIGQPYNGQTAREAGRRAREGVAPIDDLRSTAGYRSYLVGRLVQGWLDPSPPPV